MQEGLTGGWLCTECGTTNPYEYAQSTTDGTIKPKWESKSDVVLYPFW